MARTDDEHPPGRDADQRGDLLDDGDDPLERVVTEVRHTIDHVAAKVKGVLRSNR